MGCIPSAPVDLRNSVDSMLEEEQAKEMLKHKILLLGAGESGKSTVVKQIKAIYKVGGGPSSREIQDYIVAIRRNAIESIQNLIDAAKMLDIQIGQQENASILSALDSNATLDPDLGNKIAAIWSDPGIQTVYSRKSEFWLLDATPYYLNEVVRLAYPDYEPNEEDMIMTRVRTTGIVVTEVVERPYTYHVVDVGGQRSERRKWIHCFDDVRAIIFLEGLSGYNQVLFEDVTMNRMQESLNLFADVVKNPIFRKTPIFLYLNKKDLFEEMIPKHSLKLCFPEYSGEQGDVKQALNYIESKYKAIMEEHCPGKPLFICVIAARVRMDMKMAFGTVKDELKKMFPPPKMTSPKKK